jgi:hypothetical protein
MASYLRHTPSGDIYPYNRYLALREDMQPHVLSPAEMDKYNAHATPEVKIDPDEEPVDVTLGDMAESAAQQEEIVGEDEEAEEDAVDTDVEDDSVDLSALDDLDVDE